MDKMDNGHYGHIHRQCGNNVEKNISFPLAPIGKSAYLSALKQTPSAMNTVLPTSSRECTALLSQLPEQLQDALGQMTATVRKAEHMARSAWWTMDNTLLEELNDALRCCRQLTDGIAQWYVLVRWEVEAGVAYWDDYDPPADPDALRECYAALYRTVHTIDTHVRECSNSPADDERQLATLLWDCGKRCDDMARLLGTLHGGNTPTPCTRPERPPTVTINVHNTFSGCSLHFHEGSTMNGDIQHL